MIKIFLTAVVDACYATAALAGLIFVAGASLILFTQWVLWREKKREQARIRDCCPICELLPDYEGHEHV